MVKLKPMKKKKTWKLLRSLNARYERTWLCLGDFNVIIFNHEKEGGNIR